MENKVKNKSVAILTAMIEDYKEGVKNIIRSQDSMCTESRCHRIRSCKLSSSRMLRIFENDSIRIMRKKPKSVLVTTKNLQARQTSTIRRQLCRQSVTAGLIVWDVALMKRDT